MIPTPEERPALTVSEAAAFLGLSKNAAYEAVRRGEVPALRFGARLVVPTAALRQLLGLDVTPPDSPAVAPVAQRTLVRRATRARAYRRHQPGRPAA